MADSGCKQATDLSSYLLELPRCLEDGVSCGSGTNPECNGGVCSLKMRQRVEDARIFFCLRSFLGTVRSLRNEFGDLLGRRLYAALCWRLQLPSYTLISHTSLQTISTTNILHQFNQNGSAWYRRIQECVPSSGSCFKWRQIQASSCCTQDPSCLDVC